uniref:Uncharacterized protein n=1 Tax=Oreochromis niloticus TaxID=8128 RepID=A0A669BQN5_ORENI
YGACRLPLHSFGSQYQFSPSNLVRTPLLPLLTHIGGNWDNVVIFFYDSLFYLAMHPRLVAC